MRVGINQMIIIPDMAAIDAQQVLILLKAVLLLVQVVVQINTKMKKAKQVVKTAPAVILQILPIRDVYHQDQVADLPQVLIQVLSFQ